MRESDERIKGGEMKEESGKYGFFMTRIQAKTL
jgi:hypothetical protein